MMDKKAHSEVIKQQIDKALKEIENLKNQTSTVSNAGELEKFEKEIIKKTDRVAALITAKVIQDSLDSDQLRQKSTELVQSMPQRMKSQGQRDVTITSSRGGPVTVKAAYYTPKKKSKRKKKKS